MNPTPIRFATVSPVFLFGSVLLLARVDGWTAVPFFVAFLLALPILAAVEPRWLPWLVAPSIVFFLFSGAILWAAPGPPTGGLAELLSGLLLGLPLWFLGLTLGTPDRPGITLLALATGLFEIVTAGAALNTLPGGVAPSQAAFVHAWLDNSGLQLGTLANALSGGGLASAGTFPLAGFDDPIFVALAFLALGGILVPFLGTEDDPVPPVVRPDRRDLAPSPRRRAPPVLYAVRDRATPSRSPPGAGLVPVVGAVAAVIGFELLASAAPTYAFLTVTIGVAATLLLLVRLAGPYRGSAPRGPSAEPRAG